MIIRRFSQKVVSLILIMVIALYAIPVYARSEGLESDAIDLLEQSARSALLSTDENDEKLFGVEEGDIGDEMTSGMSNASPNSYTDIVLSDSNIELEVGAVYTLTYLLLPEDIWSIDVEWLTSDADIATIDDGEVIAIAPGTVNITVRSVNDPGIAATCSVTCVLGIRMTATSGDFEYSLSGTEATITKYNGIAVNVTIPDTIDGYGVVSIGSSAFAYNTALQSVIIPDSVTSLNDVAFSGCTSLSSVTLSKKLKSVGYSVFGDCISLTSIEIPKSLDTYKTNFSNGWGPFNRCSNLTNVTFEEGTTMVAPYLFAYCTGLKSIVIPSTVTEIKKSAFSNCTNLESVVLLDPLTSIGDYAFVGCTSLTTLMVPDTVSNFGNNAFHNCPKMAFYCNENSLATIYAIQNDIPFVTLSDAYMDSPNLYLDRLNCVYTSALSDISASGYISLKIDYAIKDSARSAVSDMVIGLHIPASAELVQSSLTVNGVRSTNFTVNGSNVTIPVSAAEGTVRFSVKPSEYAWFTSYATLDFQYSGTAKTEVIGIINKELPVLTLVLDPEIDNASFEVGGVAKPGQSVALSIDGELKATVMASKAGTYRETLTISNPQNYRIYEVSATSSGNKTERFVTYNEETPVLTDFVMAHNGQTYDLSAELGFKPIVTFQGGRDFEFTARFRNAENIEAIYIVSDRSNVKKKIEATWNEEKQAFYVKGYFDPSNKSYVPGVLSVEYLTIDVVQSLFYEIDFLSNEYINIVPDVIKYADYNVRTSENNNFDILVTLADPDATQIAIAYSVEDIADGTTIENAALKGYTIVSDPVAFRARGASGDKIGIKMTESYGEFVVDIIMEENDTYKNVKTIFSTVESKGENLVPGVLKLMGYGKVGDVLNTYSSYNGRKVDIRNARTELVTSNRSSAEITSGLSYLDTAQKINQHKFVMEMFFTGMAIAGVLSPPLSIAVMGMKLLSDMQMNQTMLNINSLSAMQSGGVAISFRWAIDPSGIIYDAATSAPLEGATATLYFKEHEEDTPILWDASEYLQHNPLTTNASGKYAWDVPEGLWQVKAERDGYEPAYSDWLPVPPPQVDINIGLYPSGKIVIVAIASTGGTVSGGGGFDESDTVTLVATSDSGYVFEGWYEDDVKITGATATYSFSAIANRSLEARFSAAAAMLGDVNGSGSITLADVMLIYQHYRGKSLLDGDNLLAADVNNTISVTLADVMLVYQYYRGKITSF